MFEILNDRGQDLSALDLIKNIILEKCHRNKSHINNFSKDWKKLKDNVAKSFSKGKADSIFVENIIRSEGSNLKNKEISYLSNKRPNERNSLFLSESVTHFFQRLLVSSYLLKDLNDNTFNKKTHNISPFDRSPMSCFQYSTFMKMINYNWGPQIILSSNIQYLKSSRYQNGLNLGQSPDWKNDNSNSNNIDLNHFTRFLGDITLKLGIIGIINGLATKDLPTASKEIANYIIINLTNNPSTFNNTTNLNALKDKIIGYLNSIIFTKANFDLFETRLSDTFVASSGQKANLVKILLFFIYNQGGVIHKIIFPELEHLEPQKPLSGASPYYNSADRDELINRFGNFALIDRNINISNFSNKPLKEKIRIATSDSNLTSLALFQNDLFLNLNYNNTKLNSPIYGKMPIIKKAKSVSVLADDSFDFEERPTKYFFEIRSKFLASISRNIVCNTTRFLDGNSNY